MNSVNKIILVFIVVIGIFLNFYKLDQIPSGVYIDEAVSGYNAFSILKTGKDEYGKFAPLAFRFLGSYTPPLHVYLLIPLVGLFGLSAWSIRLLSAILGSASILLLYLFIDRLKLFKFSYTSLLGTFLFAISPWNIFYSRIGYEIYLGFFLFFLGIYFFWLGLSNSKYLVWSLLILSVSTYATFSQRYLTPLIIIGLFIVFKKILLKQRMNNHLLKGVLISLLLQLPNMYLITTPSFFSKSLLFYKSVIINQAEKMNFIPNLISIPLVFLREFFSQYFTYFSPRSLFFLPDPDPQRSIPEMSVFYFWMVIPYFIGLYYLWKKRNFDSSKLVILLLLLSPIPAALVGDPFSTQRSLCLLLPLIIVIVLGIDRIIIILKKIYWLPTLIIISLFSLLLLWRSYFVLLPHERAKVWGYGFDKLAEIIRSEKETHFVIDQTRIKPSYVQLAFHLNYPPEKLQKIVNQDIKSIYYDNRQFDSYYKFTNVETRNIIWREDIYKEQILVGDEFTISDQQAKEHFLSKIFEIRSPVDEIIFVGFKTDPEKKCQTARDNINCPKI